jgi:hypothetical protein
MHLTVWKTLEWNPEKGPIQPLDGTAFPLAVPAFNSGSSGYLTAGFHFFWPQPWTYSKSSHHPPAVQVPASAPLLHHCCTGLSPCRT